MSSTSKIPALACVLTLGCLSGPGSPIRAAAQDQSEPARSAATFTVSLVLVSTEPEAIEAIPPEPQGAAAARAPYVYGPGFNGYGYYAVPGTAPARATASTTARSSGPVYRGPGTGPRRYREFGTGRSVRLAKPWLNPN